MRLEPVLTGNYNDNVVSIRCRAGRHAPDHSRSLSRRRSRFNPLSRGQACACRKRCSGCGRRLCFNPLSRGQACACERKKHGNLRNYVSIRCRAGRHAPVGLSAFQQKARVSIRCRAGRHAPDNLIYRTAERRPPFQSAVARAGMRLHGVSVHRSFGRVSIRCRAGRHAPVDLGFVLDSTSIKFQSAVARAGMRLPVSTTS